MPIVAISYSWRLHLEEQIGTLIFETKPLFTSPLTLKEKYMFVLLCFRDEVCLSLSCGLPCVTRTFYSMLTCCLFSNVL